MKKPVVIFLHFGYWLLYLLLLAVIFSIANIQLKKALVIPNFLAVLALIVLCLVPNLFSFYSFYFLLFTRFLQKKKIAVLIIFGVLVCLISAMLALAISLFFFGLNQPILSDAKEFFPLLISFFFIAAIHGGIALIIRGFITWYDEIKLKEELAQKNYETEIALLKSQLNPHFLFNTINNIDVLITKDSVKASEYLNKLSGILRYMLYETKTEKISLNKEIQYIEKYIELQKIRTSNPNYVSFEVSGDANNLQIAPMIFFPFIENAFKHTENRKNSDSIRIKILISENSINFECRNTYQTKLDKNQDFGGLGNELIRKRLELLYREKYLLEIVDNNGVYEIKLTIEV